MPKRDDPTDPGLAVTEAPRSVGDTMRDSPAIGDDVLPSSSIPGYALGSPIGAGGMGEVIVALDHVIGREVALKRMHLAQASPQTEARFLREARIQARLEHPAIVPVHALGRDAHRQPYFTMKRVTGETLADRLASADPSKLPHDLLRALVDVCQAIAFAHRRGVLHRDLKPTNIMLGEFGEVYVLDWGIARVLDEPDATRVARDLDTLDGLTRDGALIGTPGYMAPEQAEGAEVGRPADVYALGAILFEILTRDHLHPKRGVLGSTLEGTNLSPAKRCPDRAIPPELDALCVSALALDPAARPTAGELAVALSNYLDGDRDTERRRALARDALASADRAIASGDPARRGDAIRAAGRALALDPESHDAAALITRLMLTPPQELPAELARELAASDAAVQQRQGRAATLTFVAIVGFLLALATSVQDRAVFALIMASTLALGCFVAFVARRPATTRMMWAVAVGNATLAALSSRLYGPLLVTPVITCLMAVSLTSYPQLMRRTPVILAMLIVSWITPVVLERLGVLASTWRVVDGEVRASSAVITLDAASTAVLIGANVLAIIVTGLFANALARSRHAAQRDVQVQAWQLRKLLP